MKYKILVIDDDPRICKLVKSYLKRINDYEVITASDGQNGLELIDKSAFSLVISDIKMPRLDGIKLLGKVKKRDPYLPVILMTGYSDFDSLFSAMKQGANNYLVKPFDFEILKEAVEGALDFYEVAKKGKGQHEGIEKYIIQKDVVLELITDLELIRKVASYGMNIYKKCTQDDKGAQDVYVALQEILMNSLEHGNLCLGSEKDDEFYALHSKRLKDPEYIEKKIKLKIKYKANSIEFFIEDQGDGFDFKSIEDCLDPMNLFKTSGRGIFLATCFMDELEYLGCGNSVRLLKRFYK